jgi:hypothetical protein
MKATGGMGGAEAEAKAAAGGGGAMGLMPRLLWPGPAARFLASAIAVTNSGERRVNVMGAGVGAAAVLVTAAAASEGRDGPGVEAAVAGKDGRGGGDGGSLTECGIVAEGCGRREGGNGARGEVVRRGRKVCARW